MIMLHLVHSYCWPERRFAHIARRCQDSVCVVTQKKVPVSPHACTLAATGPGHAFHPRPMCLWEATLTSRFGCGMYVQGKSGSAHKNQALGTAGILEMVAGDTGGQDLAGIGGGAAAS